MEPNEDETGIPAEPGWHVAWETRDGRYTRLPVIGWRITDDGYGDLIIVRNFPADDVRVVGLEQAIKDETVPYEGLLGVYHDERFDQEAAA